MLEDVEAGGGIGTAARVGGSFYEFDKFLRSFCSCLGNKFCLEWLNVYPARLGPGTIPIIARDHVGIEVSGKGR